MEYEEEKEKVIQLLVNFLWKYKHKKLASTDYERSLLLLIDLKNDTEEMIYKKWKRERDG